MVKKLSEVEKKASTKVLGDLRKHMQDMMGDKLKGIKKVTVASDSKEGLKKGLEKAEEIVGDKEEAEEEIESPEMEASEDESLEGEELSAEEIDAKIKELLAKKEQLKK